MTILDAMESPELFGPFFRGPQWRAWKAFLGALFGLELGPNLQGIYQQHTGRIATPTQPVDEAWMIVGRGGGKSRIAGLIATFLACFRDWRPVLAPGQLALIPIIAADKDQARIAFGYITGLFEVVPSLRALLKGKPRATSLDLVTGVTMEVRAASFRTIRGYALVAAVLDEIAYWMTGEQSLNPDHEIVNAMRPGLARVPGSILVGLSSPYARKGVLYDVHEGHYGREGDPVLVWKAETRQMNPTFPQGPIDKAVAEDPAKAAAEYFVQFRDDLESYVSEQAVKDAIVPDCDQLPPREGVSYAAFTDPSGGSQDAFTLAIGHAESGRGIIDLVREKKPPFSPEAVCAEFAAECLRYGCTIVRGDHYAGVWPAEQFAKHGVTYQVSSQSKSELYLGMLPALNSRRVDLVDHPRLRQQLCALERRTSRVGKDTVDHPPGGHDDVANAVAGVLAPMVGGINDMLGYYRFLADAAGAAVPTDEPASAVAPAVVGTEDREARLRAVEALERQARRR